MSQVQRFSEHRQN